MNSKPIAIIMGSDSDLTVMQDAAHLLEDLNVGFDLTIVSAHRTPKRMVEFAEKAEAKGYKVIIAGAGGAAHLPGMVASMTVLPVIGVPVQTKSLSGFDSMMSIVQMPGGIPVATVAINGAKNAALLALQILATHDPVIHKRLVDYRESMKLEVEEKAQRLEKVGFEKYLSASPY